MGTSFGDKIVHLLRAAFEMLARVLVWQPVNIWLIAGVFGLLCAMAVMLKRNNPIVRVWPLALVCVVWTAYGFWEYRAMVERANIRIDLLIAWPALLPCTLACLWVSLRSMLRAPSSPAATQPNT